MTELNELMDTIHNLAAQIYPEPIFKAYKELEKNFHDRPKAVEIASRIKQLKTEYNKEIVAMDWDTFFEVLKESVAMGRNVSVKDIVTMEYAPEDHAHYVIDILNMVAEKRMAENKEAIRVCQSIYAFTTCLKPCAYGTYGSCLFVPRAGTKKSMAEQIFGNITTVEEFVSAIKDKSFSNNRKLITTSHKIDDHPFKVILDTIKKIRRDPDPETRDLPMCVSLGSVDEQQILQLKEAGATRLNHNLETSYFNSLYLSAMAQNSDREEQNNKQFHNEYHKRLTTLLTGLKNDMGFCSGGMFFYGDEEIIEDRILLYLTFSELDKIKKGNSSPFNVYVPLDEIVDKSTGWFNAFELPAIERKTTIDRFRILKTLLSFSLIVSSQHKIIVSAGSKWLEKEYYEIAVRVGGGAGLANYLQQIDTETTKEVVMKLQKEMAEEEVETEQKEPVFEQEY